MNRYRMYINGERVESQRGAWLPVYDPSTEEIIAEVPDAGAADIDRAVVAAVAAFESGAWPQTTARASVFKYGKPDSIRRRRFANWRPAALQAASSWSCTIGLAAAGWTARGRW